MSLLQRLTQQVARHGDVLNTLKATAPSRAAYNVGVNADLASRISQGLGSIPVAGPALSTIANVAMPVAAFGLSPVYDTMQGISRAGAQFSDQSPYGGIVDDMEVPAGPTLGQIADAIAAENIGSTMIERTAGAAQPLAEQLAALTGTTQAATIPDRAMGNIPARESVVDVAAVQAAIDRARAQEAIDARAEVKNATPATFGLADPTDRFGLDRATTGPAVEMIGGRAVPVGDVLGRQMALEKADFFEPVEPALNAGTLLSLAGLLTQSKPIQAMSMMANRDKIGRGLGSLGKRIGDFRQKTTGYRTQAEYDQARTERQQQARTDRMIDRITSGKRTRSNPRDAGTTKAQKDAISAAMRESRRGGQYDSGGGNGGGGGKVVCTMMNERYGFGSFRNKIWMKFHESYGPEYQKGYHAIFLPLVKIAKGEGKINTAVRKVLEHMGRHVTADMFKIMKGKKRDTLGRIYRAIFEPTCRIIGKIKSALGRG
jgi:hypothetical protein